MERLSYRCAVRLCRTCSTLVWMVGLTVAYASEVRVAVASNFAQPMHALVPLFERDSGHTVQTALGATGKFYAQITHGAPFDVFLAADQETPARLLEQGHAVAGSRYTYAIGKLVLWSSDPKLVDAQGHILKKGGFKHLALANPKTAPYGAAAMEVMTQMGVLDTLKPLWVQGENIAQAHQFVKTGNASLGFVAYSQVIQVMQNGVVGEGSAWVIPAHMHTAIRQDAVLLNKGRDNPAALAWLAYLQSDKAQSVIRRFGYDVR